MSMCPVCRKPLVPVSPPGGGTFSVCLDCGGRAMPLKMVERAVTPLTFKRLINQFKASRSTVDRTCPNCRSRMRRVNIDILGKTHGIEICPRCETTWFDHKEFELLPHNQEAEVEFVLPADIQSAINDIEVQDGHIVTNRSSFRLDARDFGIGWDHAREGRPGGWRLILGLLLIPVERENRLGNKPWVTWSLLAIVSIISYLGFHSLDLVESFALDPGNLWHWNGLNLLTYFFVHGGWEHLLGNMYYLWLFGDNVEDELGPLAYAGVLAAGTAGGALLHAFLDPNQHALLVGASGGISTLGMVYMLRFPRAKLAFFLLIRWIRVPAYVLMIAWVALQLKMASDQVDGLTQVSALCHVGGALVGLAYYFLVHEKRSARVH